MGSKPRLSLTPSPDKAAKIEKRLSLLEKRMNRVDDILIDLIDRVNEKHASTDRRIEKLERTNEPAK